MSVCSITRPHPEHGWEVEFGQLGHGGFLDWVYCEGVEAPKGLPLSRAVEASLAYEYERYEQGDKTERAIRELRILVLEKRLWELQQPGEVVKK